MEGQNELQQRGSHQQASQQARSPGLKRQGADRQERNVEVGDNEAPRPQVSEPEGVQNHAGPGDCQRGKYHPSQVGVGLAGRPHHQRRQHDEADGVGYEYLQGRYRRRQRRTSLIRLVPNFDSPLSLLNCRESSFCLPASPRERCRPEPFVCLRPADCLPPRSRVLSLPCLCRSRLYEPGFPGVEDFHDVSNPSNPLVSNPLVRATTVQKYGREGRP